MCFLYLILNVFIKNNYYLFVTLKNRSNSTILYGFEMNSDKPMKKKTFFINVQVKLSYLVTKALTIL